MYCFYDLVKNKWDIFGEMQLFCLHLSGSGAVRLITSTKDLQPKALLSLHRGSLAEHEHQFNF